MRRNFIFAGIMVALFATTPAFSMVLPQDCSGVNAQSAECVSMLTMASYVEQAKAQAANSDFEAAMKTMGKAIKIAKNFPAEIYVEYVIDQAEYAESWARDYRGVKGLEQALAILQRAIPYLGQVDSVSTKSRYYNRISGLYIELANTNKDPTYSEAALETFQHIIEIIDKETDPGYWASIHYNLGVAYVTHFEHTKEVGNLILGKNALLEAQKYFDKKTMLKDWAKVVSALADNDVHAAKAFNRPDLQQKAMNSYVEIAKSLKGTPYKEELANAYHNGALLSEERGRDTENLKDLKLAYIYFGKAADIYYDQRNYFAWVRANSNQAWAQYYLAKLTDKPEDFEGAVDIVEYILENFPQHKSPVRWAEIVKQLADCKYALALNKSDTSLLGEAMQSYRVSMKIFEEEGRMKQHDEASQQATNIMMLLLSIEGGEKSEEPPKEDSGV
ncbi:MAG: hypothetical protein HWE34_18150 [Methylocystaceae bacterium]|nr:hypothetical protein [Methylocystaceae bacterium]